MSSINIIIVKAGKKLIFILFQGCSQQKVQNTDEIVDDEEQSPCNSTSPWNLQSSSRCWKWKLCISWFWKKKTQPDSKWVDEAAAWLVRVETDKLVAVDCFPLRPPLTPKSLQILANTLFKQERPGTRVCKNLLGKVKSKRSLQIRNESNLNWSWHLGVESLHRLQIHKQASRPINIKW